MRDDWRAWLPDCKAQINDNCVKELETLYVMLSVSLNEAIELRRKGEPNKSHEAVEVARVLCGRFVHSMEFVLRGIHLHAKRFALVPNAVPLGPENFLGSRGQRTARLATLLSHVLFTQRSRFVHKVVTLQEMVNDLGEGFSKAVEDLLSGLHVNSSLQWEALDHCHFDLNTCLRETFVLLKSFLMVLPEEQVAAFEEELQLSRLRTATGRVPFRHGRFAAVPGK